MLFSGFNHNFESLAKNVAIPFALAYACEWVMKQHNSSLVANDFEL